MEIAATTSYPLLGPLFIGTLLNWHRVPTRLQFEHCSTPDSDVASQRIFIVSVVKNTSRIHGDEVPSSYDIRHKHERLLTASLVLNHRSSDRDSGQVLLAPIPRGKLAVSSLAQVDWEAPSPVHLQCFPSYWGRRYATVARTVGARRPTASAADSYRTDARRHPFVQRWEMGTTELGASWTRLDSGSGFSSLGSSKGGLTARPRWS